MRDLRALVPAYLSSAVPRIAITPWLLAALLAVSGCSDNLTGPTEPEPPVVLPNPVPLIEVLTDISDRVMPALPSHPRREDLDRALQLLWAAVGRGMVSPVRSAIAGANTALARYAEVVGDDIGTLVELDVIQLSLNFITVQVDAVAAN